jgi:succinyl-diaminopimelate desuccinylase
MESTEILKQLINISSCVDSKTNESAVGLLIYDYLKKNTNFSLKKQYVDKKRFNVIAQKGNRIDTFITGHIDTVQPSSGWTKKPIQPKIVGDRLYGLGSSDMKSGIAIMLKLATLSDLRNNTAFLFYCDEEYDFLGMKKFIQEYKDKINPKLIISLDSEGLQIGNSCRGLIEMKVTVGGKTGHAARPKSGINAILESQKVIVKLEKWLQQFSTKDLGDSTLNIAYIRGGTNMGTENGEIVLGKEGNIVPDYCEYVAETRVASPNLNATKVKQFITENSVKAGLKIVDVKVRHDLGSWITPKTDLKNILNKSPNRKFRNPKESGYIDIQMLWETFGKVPTFSYGAGEPGMSHKPDEFVRISNVMKAQKFYEDILTTK